MKPIMIVLDDWEGKIQASDCWKKVKDSVEVRFLQKSIEHADDAEINLAEFLMAVRERTVLNATVFDRMPRFKLVLQTGGHAYHIDTIAARQRKISIALGRKAKAPLLSVPELTFAYILGLIHKVPQANKSMKGGKWELFTGRTLSGRRLGILGLGRHGSRVAWIASTACNMEVVAWDRGKAN
jgi:phosphoglycerate dehydrogenase-like enzyme